jgi:uncharacterized protein
MYIKTEFGEFEWDEAKNRFNQEKHAIDFIDAMMVFAGQPYIKRSDNSGTDKERFVAVGYVNKAFWAVVFTYRQRKLRIISARKAREDEKEAYFESLYGRRH